MKTRKSLLILVILAIILSACNSGSVKVYDSVDALVKEAKAKAEFVKVDELKTIIDNEHNFLIVDCREPDIYAEGHIPGSINIPRGLLEFSSKISNRGEAVYIYCENYQKAVLAAESLAMLKYKIVKVVDGGWVKWSETYPDLVEEGTGGSAKEEVAKPAESGGCGG